MKRHQIHILTSRPGKTWASCSTCGRKSKQGTKANAEEWMAKHLRMPLPKKQKS
jgi:hypothetical protein